MNLRQENIKRRERSAAVREQIVDDIRNAKRFKKDADEVPATLEKLSQPVNNTEKSLPKVARPRVPQAKPIPQGMLLALTSKRSRIAPVSQQIMPSHLSNKPKISAVAKPKQTNNPTNTDKKGPNSRLPIIPTDRISNHRSMPDINW